MVVAFHLRYFCLLSARSFFSKIKLSFRMTVHCFNFISTVTNICSKFNNKNNDGPYNAKLQSQVRIYRVHVYASSAYIKINGERKYLEM